MTRFGLQDTRDINVGDRFTACNDLWHMPPFQTGSPSTHSGFSAHKFLKKMETGKKVDKCFLISQLYSNLVIILFFLHWCSPTCLKLSTDVQFGCEYIFSQEFPICISKFSLASNAFVNFASGFYNLNLKQESANQNRVCYEMDELHIVRRCE